MESTGRMFHARIYPGTKAPKDMGSPYEVCTDRTKPMMTPKGMLHDRIYPGKMAAVDMGSPYVNRKGMRAAPTADNPKLKGKPNLESSVDPLAMRTSGFA
jgi:hypothetical protein